MSDEGVDCLLKVLNADYISSEGMIALVSIIVMLLIPIAVLTFNKRQEGFPIDNRIVFNEIFMHKYFIALITPISITFLFPQIKLITAILTIILAIISMKVLTNTFKWLIDDKKGLEYFKQEARIEYLRKLRSNKEILSTWSAILSSDNVFSKTGLLEVYLDSERYVKNDDNCWSKDLFWRLLKDNYSKIQYDDIETYKRLVDKTLDYYLKRKIWQEKDGCNIDEMPPEALRQVSQVVLKDAVTSDNGTVKSYLYFDIVNDYLESLNDVQKELFLSIYLDDLFNCFIKNNIDYREKWHGKFFEKIEINNLNIDKPLSSSVFNSYYRNVISRYICRSDNPPDEIARSIDYLTQHVFKEIDPITWFRVISFIVWPYSYDEDLGKNAKNRIISWCQRSRNYGVFGRFDCSVFSTPQVDKKNKQKMIQEKVEADIKKEMEATYKLIVYIFKLSKKEYELYLETIIKLEKQYDNSSLEFERLESLKTIVERLIKLLK